MSESKSAIPTPSLVKTNGFVFATSTRERGDLGLARGQAGQEARDLFVKTQGLAKPLVCCQQVHGTKINEVKDPVGRVFSASDGVYVPPGLAVTAGAFSADCLAIGLIDLKLRGFSLVHSGWRGTHAGMPERALATMLAGGARLSDLVVIFSPSIQACCYQVGNEFYEYFPKACLTESEKGLYFDHQRAAIKALVSAGLRREQIIESRLCTACDPEKRFYSWRREGQTAGRLLTILADTTVSG